MRPSAPNPVEDRVELSSYRLSPEARLYALKELARRAGVSREFFHTWSIDISPEETTVAFSSGQSQKIIFPHLHESTVRVPSRSEIPVANAAWLQPPKDPLLHNDLVLPFLDSPGSPSSPLFQSTSDGSFVCAADLLLSLLFTLSRVEETICNIRDGHGRFPASASLAARHGFLERPIVDEWGLAFEQVLSALLPAWQPQRPPLRVKLTHDIDTIGIPFQLRTSLGHAWKRRQPSATLLDLVSTFSSTEPAELAAVRTLAQISKTRGFHSAFFWKASPATPNDSGYDPFHPKVQRILSDLKRQGCELGVHPGYDTYGSRESLQQEIARLEQALNVTHPGGRQHYLRWSPQTWHDWEACNLSYDSSVGFADAIGFRAGTAVPYRPWSLVENRELQLVELPLIVMDCTPVKYMRLQRDAAIERVRACIQRTAQVGGVFSLLWHNFPLLEPEYAGWYDSILDLLPANSSASFSSLASLW